MKIEERRLSPLVDLVIGPGCGQDCAMIELLHAQSRDNLVDALVKRGHQPYKVVRAVQPGEHADRCIK